MSTPTLKPKPVRSHNKSTSQGQRMTRPGIIYSDKTVTKKKTMTEQTTTPQSLTKVQSHLPDVYLIERDALWNDMQQRIKIHNYECKTALEDLKKVVNQTKELYSRVTASKD